MEPLARKRILVVDPDPSICTLIVALLKRDGYEPDATHDAEEALTLGASRQYAAMILEPRIRGGEALLDAMQSGVDGEGSNIIIVTSADGVTEPSQRPGVRAVLWKPFVIEELSAAVAASCANQGWRAR